MANCPRCHKQFSSLPLHFFQCPDHDPQQAETAPKPEGSSTDGHEAGSHFQKKFARQINTDYARMRYKQFIETSTCAAFHLSAVGWMNLISTAMIDAAESARTLEDAKHAMRNAHREATEVMTKYHSQAMRDQYLIKVLKVPYIEPLPFDPASPEQFRKDAAQLCLKQTVARMLQHDAKARKLIKAKSDEWMSGVLHMKKATMLCNIDDGWRIRSSDLTKKHVPSFDAEGKLKRVMRIGIGVHNDDATFVNPIGTKKGDHKGSVTECNIINLPLNMRNAHEYLLLSSFVNSKLLKDKGGLQWSMCGVDAHGKTVVPNSLSAAFLTGEYEVMLPDDDNPMGPDILWYVQLHFVIAEADYLSNTAMGFTPESTSASHPCPECMWVLKAARKRGHAGAARSGGGPEPAARTHANMAATAAALKRAGLSKSDLAEAMRAAGLNSLSCVLQPDRFPGSDSVRDKPADVMHVLAAGLTRIEECHCLEIVFKPGKPGTVLYVGEDPWAQLNSNIARLNSSLPRGKKLPNVHPQRKGKKINEQHMDFNSSETLLFAMHFETLVAPILNARGLKAPCWLSMMAHVAVVQKVLQHAYAATEADELATLIAKFLDAFDSVPEYADLDRPKHHFTEHLVRALLDFGPFRGFWCMPFEGFLQVRCPSFYPVPFLDRMLLTHRVPSLVTLSSSDRGMPAFLSPVTQLIKKIINMSNFRNSAYHVCSFWSMRSAILLMEKVQDIRDDAIMYSSNPQFPSEDMIEQSPLIRSVRAHETALWGSVFATQHVRSFERGSLEVRGGDWVLASVGSTSIVGRVGEIIEFSAAGGSFMRLHMLESRRVTFDEMHGGRIVVPRASPSSEQCVHVESAAFHEVHCDDSHSLQLSFTYIY